MTTKVLLARPYFRSRDPESDDAAKRASLRDDVEVHVVSHEDNVTCNNFNSMLALCMNKGIYDYFALLHGDVAPADGFIDAMLESIESHDLDATHCPQRYKNDSGKVMTALGRIGKFWGPNRELTTAELSGLPQTFTAADLSNLWDMPDRIMLPATGCMLLRLGDWIQTFPGFQMIYEFGRRQDNGEWVARCVTEDYWFGHWAGKHGVKVGCTNHPTGHWGRREFRTDDVCGQETDDAYVDLMEKLQVQVA